MLNNKVLLGGVCVVRSVRIYIKQLGGGMTDRSRMTQLGLKLPQQNNYHPIVGPSEDRHAVTKATMTRTTGKRDETQN